TLTLSVHCTTHSFYTTHTAPPSNYPLSLHDALPIFLQPSDCARRGDFFRKPDGIRFSRFARADRKLGKLAPEGGMIADERVRNRSEEHTSELQSRENLVCRLLLEKK